MRHANSNLNILKKNRNSKNIKYNNFLKPPLSSNNFNSPITTKTSNNKNILYNLIYKDNSKISIYNTKNTTNTFKNINEISNSRGAKYSFSNKNINNNSISLGNSLNYKENRRRHSHINIRLKLNNKIINKKKPKQKEINYDIIEKIKEKDSKINKLQKDLFQSQDLLNKLQKNKQKDLNFTYNSIKSLDNLNIYTKDYQISDFFIPTAEKNDKILKTNFNKFEMNKNKKKLNSNSKNKKTNYKANKNLKVLLKIDSLININTNNIKTKKNNKNSHGKNSLSGIKNSHNNYIKNKNKNFPTNKYLKCFSSSANRFFPHGHRQYESCISLTRTTFKNKKNEKSINYKKKDNLKLSSPSKKNYSSPSFKNLITKCNLLKNKAYKILSNYISLTEYINNNSE